MFTRSAELYDRIYLELKDYEAEALKIRELIAQKRPQARTVLDVACGTGEHARILRREYGFEVDGIDLDANLIRLAQKKNPGASFVRADMVDFHIDGRYDVVMCLFSSIGYVKTLPRVTRTLERIKAHTKHDGLILIEPWFQPGCMTPGRLYLNTSETGDLKVVRMGYTEVSDRLSTIHFEYLIGTPGKVEHESETHELGLFSVDEMMVSFRDAGLTATFDEEGFSGRGLYLATNRSG